MGLNISKGFTKMSKPEIIHFLCGHKDVETSLDVSIILDSFPGHSGLCLYAKKMGWNLRHQLINPNKKWVHDLCQVLPLP